MNCRTQVCVFAVACGLSVALLGCGYNEASSVETASNANFDRGSSSQWHRQINKVDSDEDGIPDDRGVMAFDEPQTRTIYGYDQDRTNTYDQHPTKTYDQSETKTYEQTTPGPTQTKERDTFAREQQPQGQASTVIANWPQGSKQAAQEMIKKYGQPDMFGPTMLIWNNNSPWVRTVVYREGFDHNFPVPHKDCLEQTVRFKVPVDRFDEVASFDGSIICDRTAGYVTARCNAEPMNFAALNLAYKVANGDMSVDEARSELARIAAALQGERDAITQQLQFQGQGGQTGDPDQPMRGGDRTNQPRRNTNVPDNDTSDNR